MNSNSSVEKTCLGENVIEISSEEAEGHGDWNSPEYQDTTNNGGKKETKAIIFQKMDTEEVSGRYVAPCFVNGLEVYDGKINLTIEENMISNEFAVKLCLEHKNGTITIYPEFDLFLDSSGEEEKIGDDWDLLLDDLDFGDSSDIEGVEIPPFVCKMGKNSRNKRKQLEKYQLIYSDMGPSLSTGKPLTNAQMS
nr:hypothetical protein [Tanacetum cinerariifolium]